MLPLIPFVAGILTGVTAIRLLKSETTRTKLDQAKTRLRESAATSLNTLETGYTKVKQRFTQTVEEAPETAPETPPQAASTEKPQRRKKSAPAATSLPKPRRRAAAKPKASPEGTQPVTKEESEK